MADLDPVINVCTRSRPSELGEGGVSIVSGYGCSEGNVSCDPCAAHG